MSGTASQSQVAADDARLAASTQRKASLHLLPVIALGYLMAYMDRINISFAALRMNSDLHFSATVYGTGAGLFFLGYALCEVPSNLLLLRFGPRKWLARIMLTWGLLATSMLLVRTPTQFYVVRLLLGVAEAGFFPGVLYYLTLWFPSRARARAVSRFYIAFPLSSVVMGVLAGWLMGLNGHLGLAGWQWLFLVEGVPPIFFSYVILRALPDTPAQVSWLTAEEKSWLDQKLRAEGAQAHLNHSAGFLSALLSPKVWLIGMYFFCVLTCGYGTQFTLPIILTEATGWNVPQVGYMVAANGLAGAVAMLLGAASSDRTGERALHCIIPCCLIGVAYIVSSLPVPPWAIVVSLLCAFICLNVMQGPALALPTEFLAGRAAAAGIAAMNTITMFSGLIGPYWMGRVKDSTGSYALGLRGLAVPGFAAAILMYVLTRSLARRPAPAEAETQLADGAA